MIESIRINNSKVEILDQTQLPFTEKYILIDNYKEMAEAIYKLKIRGAPAIGIAAAAGCYLASLEFSGKENSSDMILRAIIELENTRPTAVNLVAATSKIKNILKNNANNLTEKLYKFMIELMNYEKIACEKMSCKGAKLIGKVENVLTHCNTGSLATYGVGTALGVIREIAKKHRIKVFADETRPLLQGARLTMWELNKSKIPAVLITDNMAAQIIKKEKIDCIIVGADRIAKNGDSANKIGTFGLSILAKYFKIPFYIVAPETSIDRNIETGDEIKIEERNYEEVCKIKDYSITSSEFNIANPAFDVTPSELITAIITDEKIYQYPYRF